MNQLLKDALWAMALVVLGVALTLLGSLAVVKGAYLLAPHLNTL